MLKAVVDSNVIIGGFLSRIERSANFEVLQALLKCEFDCYSTEQTLEEISFFLSLPRARANHKLTDSELKNFLSRLAAVCIKVEPIRLVPHTLTRDVTDTKFLDLAVNVDAEYIVTFDHGHLLRLKKIGRTQILTPHKFLLALRRTWRTK